MGKTYKITLTEKQLRITKVYLETIMRLYMGQDGMFADSIAMMTSDMSPDNPNHKKIFDSYIMRRDHVRAIMKSLYQIAFEPYGYLDHKTDEMLELETIWDAMRSALGDSRWNSPMQMGHEPVPEIEIKESTDDGKR